MALRQGSSDPASLSRVSRRAVRGPGLAAGTLAGGLGATSRSREAMDGFARMMGGVTSPTEFFSDENVGRIIAAAA